MTIEDIRNVCRSFPGATEDIKWGADLCFCVGAKMFCVTGLDQFPVSISFKVPDEDFEEVSVRPAFSPAKYMARHKWVTVEDTRKVSARELQKLIRQSYTLVREKLPKKIKDGLK